MHELVLHRWYAYSGVYGQRELRRRHNDQYPVQVATCSNNDELEAEQYLRLRNHQ